MAALVSGDGQGGGGGGSAVREERTMGLGFELDQFVSPPPDVFICPVCMLVLNSPTGCENGHVFCRSCLFEYLNRKKECPTCCVAINRNHVQRNLVVENMISELMVRCEHRVSGCAWEGRLIDSGSHKDSCDFKLVDCPLFSSADGCCADCPGQVRRCDTVSHLTHPDVIGRLQLLLTRSNERAAAEATRIAELSSIVSARETTILALRGQVETQQQQIQQLTDRVEAARRSAVSASTSVSDERMSPTVIATIKRAIVRAINRGAPMYNAGDISGCANLYQITAQECIREGARSLAQARLEEALETCDMIERSDDEKAWALRRAFDAILDAYP
jgi:Zinc finger, C3HC4 type (RING finger)